MESNLAISLLSGLAGSVLTMAITLVRDHIRHEQERKNLYEAIASECRYNLSILDEVTNGTVNACGSFKRMSVEFFKTIRQQSISYSLSKDLLLALSWVIVDLELFNMEADFVFNENLNRSLFVGDFDKKPICIIKKSIDQDISSTVKSARLGVRGSLQKVLKIVSKELGEEDTEN